MSRYETDYYALPRGVKLTPGQHELYASVRRAAGQDGSDTYDQLKAVASKHTRADVYAVAAALGGSEATAEHFG